METAADWKHEVNERLAAHRTRRTRSVDEAQSTLPGLDLAAGGQLKSSIAAKVAARYAKAPTYSDMLAAEAQNAATAAAAAARAANQAQAAAQAILTGLDIRSEAEVEARATRANRASGSQGHAGRERGEDRPDSRTETRREGWQDTLSQSLRGASDAVDCDLAPLPSDRAVTISDLRISLADDAVEGGTYEDEAVEYVEPTPLTGNLIQFPRELFATRRARPRLAEGPMREDAGADPGQSQLRIFEVEAESISTEPVVAHTQTEWSSIRLGSLPAQHSATQSERLDSQEPARRTSVQQAVRLETPLQTACLEDRTMAAVVDLALVTAAFLIFVLAFAACASHLPTGRPALIGMAVSYLAIALGYQLLFFAYAESTPGMRYARIALCTFDDENPTRKAMRVRVAAMLLSLCPVGLGCAWVFFDEDHLSWHDRITRSYQRSYR